MEKKIIFIHEGMSFMVDAISKNLQAADYTIVHAAPTIEGIEAQQKESDICVFYLGEFISERSDVLVYLKDICQEQEKSLLLIGNPVELSMARDYIPEVYITSMFERPLDIKKLIAELDRLLMADEIFSRRKNILVVDDDGAFLKMVRSWLSPMYHVTIVTSGAQALMYVADNTPDLILLDYDMPVTSGPQVFEMLRSESKAAQIPVMFLTGKGDRESVLQVLALKPDGYLLKSMTRDKLLSSIGTFFEKRKYERIN